MSTTRDLKRFLLLVFGIMFLVTVTFLRCGPIEGRNTLTGKVEWTAIDERNRINGVVIATQTGDYLVGDDAKGRELLQLVNKKVNVRGRVTEDEHGQKTVYVSAYETVPQ